jgi:hypothetical protein
MRKTVAASGVVHLIAASLILTGPSHSAPKGRSASPLPGKGTASPASRPKPKGRYDRLPRPWSYHCRGYDPATGRRICRIVRSY